MIKLGGGCMPLYSSKDLANNNHGTRKKTKNMQIFLTNSKNAKTNPSYKILFITKARERPPRDSAPLQFTRQEMNHSTRERDDEFSQ
jgi:hypothetical protein